jgi:hypothetical protein
MVRNRASATGRAWWLSCLYAFAVTASIGCGDGDEKPTPDPDAGRPIEDAGIDSAAPSDVPCGTRTCRASTSDAVWGGEACCVDEARAECGVKADDPTVDDGTGMQVRVRDVLEAVQAADADAGIVETCPRTQRVTWMAAVRRSRSPWTAWRPTAASRTPARA